MSDDTYSSATATDMSLSTLKLMLGRYGCDQIFVKALAPNDNSKNQIYLASHPDHLRSIPKDNWEIHELTSKKPNTANKKILRAEVPFNWLLPDGSNTPAKAAKLIFYPQYPEVRFSGFLQGAAINASDWMQPQKQGRSKGRFLIWGVSRDQTSYAYLAVPNSQISKALSAQSSDQGFKNFNSESGLTTLEADQKADPKSQIISKIRDIYLGNPHAGAILKNGILSPNTAPNAGGTTLESLFGIDANGEAQPDFLGWEIKGHSGNVITMLTPEPDGGCYRDEGVETFIRRYGYPDKKGIEGRINFGGTHRVGYRTPSTNLELKLLGYNPSAVEKSDVDGCVALVDKANQVAASWSFPKLLNHWQTKHANTVFVPFKRTDNHFNYNPEIFLGEGTSFANLLRGFANQAVYYDPGIKLEGDGIDNKIKRRSQFRVTKKNLAPLFDNFTTVNVLDTL